MTSAEDILAELKEIAPSIANINRTNVYSVRGDYFNDLPKSTLEHVKKDLFESKLAPSKVPFFVPAGYFDRLSSQIMQKVIGQSVQKEIYMELAEIAPLLNTISRSATYSVPDGYFENLTLQSKTMKPGIVSITRTGRFLRYAVAAVISGLLVLGGIRYTGEDKIVKSTGEVSNFSQQVNQLSEEEIENYLKNYPATDVPITNAESENQKINTRDLTEEEILNFLRENDELNKITDLEG